MSSANSSFDPRAQNITMLAADGVTQIFTPIPQIDAWYDENIRVSILYGGQLAACLVMFFVTMALTKPSKRRTPVYRLNLASLFLGFIRGLLLVLYYDSAWNEFFTFWAGEFDTVPRSAYGESVAAVIIYTIFVGTVASSLVLQAHTVTKAVSRKWRYILTGLSVVVLLLLVGTRFAASVMNSIAIINASFFYNFEWLMTFARAMECLAIWWFSLIFTGKLIYTLWARKNMGLRAWSYLEVLVAMGLCTMVIPSVFAILEWTDLRGFPRAGTLALCFVVLLLPLSSLWASMAINEPSSTFSVSNLWASDQSCTCPQCITHCAKSFTDTTTAATSNLSSSDRMGNSTPATTNSVANLVASNNRRRDSTEVDLQLIGVRIDRSYSVHSEKATRAVDV